MRRSAHCPRDEYNGTICAAVRFSVAAITVATCSNVMEGFLGLLFCFFLYFSLEVLDKYRFQYSRSALDRSQSDQVLINGQQTP